VLWIIKIISFEESTGKKITAQARSNSDSKQRDQLSNYYHFGLIGSQKKRGFMIFPS